MGRPSRFQRAELLEAGLRLVAERGPRGVTVAALAKEVGAPSGSIYYRFQSRDELLAEIWMDVVERFQAGFVSTLAKATDIDGAAAAARFMAEWTRTHLAEARVLLLHRRQDFFAGAWPPHLVDRAAALEPQIGAALRSFARRAFGRADRRSMAVLRFALLDAPLGGSKPYIQAGTAPPALMDDLAEDVVRAVLARLAASAEGSP